MKAAKAMPVRGVSVGKVMRPPVHDEVVVDDGVGTDTAPESCAAVVLT